MSTISPNTDQQPLATDHFSRMHDDLRQMALAELIRYILARYHERHRVQLSELIALARKVEHVHADHPDCPSGLADSLENIQQSLESHMMKEERVLFPMLLRGDYAQAQGPISVMCFEHGQHEEALDDISAITNRMQLPADACGTWRALYAKLSEFHNDLVQHIQLENDVLFSKAKNAVEGAHYG